MSDPPTDERLTFSKRLAIRLTKIQLGKNGPTTTFETRVDHNYLLVVSVIGAAVFDAIKDVASQIGHVIFEGSASRARSHTLDRGAQQIAKAPLPPLPIGRSRRHLITVVPANQNIVGSVTLYADTWYTHIIVAHPELRHKLPSVQRVIAAPSAIYKSSSGLGSLIFVRRDIADSSGRLLRVVVRPGFGLGMNAVVPTIYFSAAHSGEQIWP
jgi:hypothetical protein